MTTVRLAKLFEIDKDTRCTGVFFQESSFSPHVRGLVDCTNQVYMVIERDLLKFELLCKSCLKRRDLSGCIDFFHISELAEEIEKYRKTEFVQIKCEPEDMEEILESLPLQSTIECSECDEKADQLVFSSDWTESYLLCSSYCSEHQQNPKYKGYHSSFYILSKDQKSMEEISE